MSTCQTFKSTINAVWERMFYENDLTIHAARCNSTYVVHYVVLTGHKMQQLACCNHPRSILFSLSFFFHPHPAAAPVASSAIDLWLALSSGTNQVVVLGTKVVYFQY